MAKKVVRAAQEKSRKAREKLKNESEVIFTSQKVTKIIFESITLTNHVIPTGLLLPVIFRHGSKWEQS